MPYNKVEIFLEQREVAFLSPSKFSQILLGDKNATSLCSKNIFTLLLNMVASGNLFSYQSVYESYSDLKYMRVF